MNRRRSIGAIPRAAGLAGWLFAGCLSATGQDAASPAPAVAAPAAVATPVPRRGVPNPPPLDAEPAAPGGPVAAAPGGPVVNFNFDAADIRLLAKLVGEMTGRRFVVGDKVTGNITVVSPTPVPAAQVYPLFLSVLESRGFTVIDREGATFIVPMIEQTGMVPTPVVTGPGGTGLVTRIFRLQHAEAADFAKAIEPMVRGGKAGMIVPFPPSNQVIVTDTEDNLRRISQILEQIDQTGASRTIEVVRLQYASADELGQQVMAALTGAEKAGSAVSRHLRQVAEGGATLPADALVVASAQANSLVLVGTPVQITELKRIIALLDIEPGSGHGRMNAIFLKYLSADEAAKSLTALLAKTVDKDARQRMAIEANVANNALIVDATPMEFQRVRELVESLDLAPQQVMVEILIAEVAVGKQLDLGVEWASIETPDNDRLTALGRSRPGSTDAMLDAVKNNVFPQGLAVGVAKGTDANGLPRVPFMLQALAQNRDLRILSSVPLWAQNNVEAKVNVVENIPVLKSTIEGGAGTSRDVIQNIDRMDVGIKLVVTPHVNPDREITLQLNPTIEAVTDPGSSETQFAPTIARREVKTTVTVPDGATVVLSGLIRDDRVKQEYKVPLLGDIPVLGWLFRYHMNKNQRNNLLIFVTPRLVKDMHDADAMSRSLEKRTEMPGVVDQARGVVTNAVPAAKGPAGK